MKKGRSFFDLLPFFLFMVQISFPKNRLYEGYTIRYSIRVLSIRFGFRARHLFYRSIICIPHGEKQDKTEASEDRINRYKYLIFR